MGFQPFPNKILQAFLEAFHKTVTRFYFKALNP
jgi:hypothetical protein